MFDVTKLKDVRVQDAMGKYLAILYDCDQRWASTPVGIAMPGGTKLFSFDVPYGKTTLLVLNPSGDSTISPPRLHQRVVGFPEHGGTIAIDRQLGQIYRVSFYREGTMYSMGINAFEKYSVPRKFCKRLDETQSMQRPYDLSVRDSTIFLYIDREVGVEALRESLVVRLSFVNQQVEIWQEGYRTISPWKSTPAR
jgi:hypothetical protein